MFWLVGLTVIFLRGVICLRGYFDDSTPRLHTCQYELNLRTPRRLLHDENCHVGFEREFIMESHEHMLVYGCVDPASNEAVCLNHPTLNPHSAIVSKASLISDIYSNPPRRQPPLYPQPNLFETATECKKDKCLLPDCHCGENHIPGNMTKHDVPQMVLITFDDGVNDMNYPLYQELFDSGFKNPNGCPITATFYVCDIGIVWTDYSYIQNLYAAGHEIGSHSITHRDGVHLSNIQWNEEIVGQREILAAFGGIKLEDIRGMRAPFFSIGGDEMFKMLYEANFTYDASICSTQNNPPSWPYTLDYKMYHQCIMPCPTKSYPGVWEIPITAWNDLNGQLCCMSDYCASPPDAEGVFRLILNNFQRHYTTNRAPFGLFYHAHWFSKLHHKEGFKMFLDAINQMKDVWIVTNWQALQWIRDPTPISRLNNFQPFQCNYQDRPKRCDNPNVCLLREKQGIRYLKTCSPCPEVYP